MNETRDVAVVGAGAAGVGVAAALEHLDVDTVVLERETIGSSFRNWPEEMRLITPSYPSNAFGFPDLNAVVPNTSPAVAFDCQQLTGEMYASYLEAVAESYDIDVRTGVTVTAVESAPEAAVVVDGGTAVEALNEASERPGFTVETTEGELDCSFVVWAGGEFSHPRRNVFPGSEHCVHSAEIDSWAKLAADSDGEHVVIGGSESGIDAAVNLVEAGASVTVLDRGHPWARRHPDPSETLSPYTLQRLDSVRGSERLDLVGGAEVERVERFEDSFEIYARPADSDLPGGMAPNRDGGNWQERTEHRFETPNRPVLATGFDPRAGPIGELFPIEDGSVRLTDRDESPETPGLFLAGPAVAHDGQAFCFVYKFRSRFPVVAETIGNRLGVETAGLDVYREAGMFLDDLSCCEPIDCDC